MRRILGLATFAAIAFSSSGAFAFIPDCAGPTGVTVAPDHRSASIIPDFFTPGFPAACKQSVDVPLPAGSFGVYKVDVRGFTAQVDGDKSTYSVTVDGVIKTKVLKDEYLNDVEFTKYFGMGSGGSASFDPRFDLLVTGDLGSWSEIDTVDVLAAYTSLTSVQGSLTQIASGETAIVTHLNASAGLLAGANQKLEGGNEIGLLGGVGSYMLGVTARYNLSGGFSLLGGMSLVNQTEAGASISGPLAVAAVRYVEPGINSFRLFGEGGLSIAGLGTTFTRHYADGTPNGVTVTSSTEAALGSIYARGGVVIAPDDANEIVLSATLEESLLGVTGYSETLGAANLFPATFADRTGHFTTVKGTIAWTTDLVPNVDLTATASLGAVLAHDPVTANVMFVGPVSGGGAGTLFAEYGLRLGWTPSPTTTIDGFLQGSTGTGIGTHVQVGAGARMRF